MKFGQYIEYKMKNIFLEKSYTKCVRETIPRPFSKNQNWAYLPIINLKFYIFCFYSFPSWGLLKGIESDFHVSLGCLIADFKPSLKG